MNQISQIEKPRRSDQKKNELKLSWEKKVSLREIAQFYEDKIRELDGKTQRLTEQTRMLSERSEKLMDELTEKVDKALDERAAQKISGINKQILSFEAKIEDLNQRANIAIAFLSRYEDVKDMIESERKVNLDSLQSVLESLNRKAKEDAREQVDKIVRAQKEGSIEGILRAQVEVDHAVATFYQFVYEHDRSYFETQETFFKFAKKHPEVFLPMAQTHIQGDTVSQLALPVIESMIDDYMNMFSTIKDQDMDARKVKGPIAGSDQK